MWGQVEHVLTMAYLEKNTSLFTPRPTVERNIETRGGKGEFYFGTRVWDYDSISNGQKTSF